MINLILVDDHTLFRQTLAHSLKIKGNGEMRVVAEVSNGEQLKTELKKEYLNSELADIILMDIQMPLMDGRIATSLVRKIYPSIKVIALSQFVNEYIVIDLLRRGASGFVSKMSEIEVLLDAIYSVTNNSIFVEKAGGQNLYCFPQDTLSDQQRRFLGLCVSDLTYKEIAAEMHLSDRTLDNYRDALFKRLNVRTRIGLALYAVRTGLAAL